MPPSRHTKWIVGSVVAVIAVTVAWFAYGLFRAGTGSRARSGFAAHSIPSSMRSTTFWSRPDHFPPISHSWFQVISRRYPPRRLQIPSIPSFAGRNQLAAFGAKQCPRCARAFRAAIIRGLHSTGTAAERERISRMASIPGEMRTALLRSSEVLPHTSCASSSSESASLPRH